MGAVLITLGKRIPEEEKVRLADGSPAAGSQIISPERQAQLFSAVSVVAVDEVFNTLPGDDNERLRAAFWNNYMAKSPISAKIIRLLPSRLGHPAPVQSVGWGASVPWVSILNMASKDRAEALGRPQHYFRDDDADARETGGWGAPSSPTHHRRKQQHPQHHGSPRP